MIPLTENRPDRKNGVGGRRRPNKGGDEGGMKGRERMAFAHDVIEPQIGREIFTWTWSGSLHGDI